VRLLELTESASSEQCLSFVALLIVSFSRVIGPRSKNPVTRARTIFKALLVQQDPEAQAKSLGKMLFNPNKVWRRRQYTSIY
jgi:hypothetical protein